MLEWCWYCLGGFCNFHFNCYSVIESPHSYIPRIHVTIITSSSLVKTLVGPHFVALCFPIEMVGKGIEWYVPRSTCLSQRMCPLLNCLHGCLQCLVYPFLSLFCQWDLVNYLTWLPSLWCKLWGHILLVQGCLVYHNIVLLVKYIEHHDGLAPLGLSLQQVMAMHSKPIRMFFLS